MRRLFAPTLLLGAALSCGGFTGEPYKIAVMMPMLGAEHQPDLEWAKIKVNDAGGISGESELQLEYFDVGGMATEQRVALAQQLADDASFSAVITGGGSDYLLDIVPVFIDAQKPVLSSTEAAGELLRAFSGNKFLWRTKLNDLIQVEFILRDLHERVGSVALLSSLDHGGQTFFDWFGFYARDLGFTTDTLTVGTMLSGQDCGPELDRVLAAQPETLVVAATAEDEFKCAIEGLDARRLPDGSLPAEIVIADLGLNARVELEKFGAKGAGMTGWIGGSPEAERALAEWESHSEDPSFPWGGEPGHDGVMLLAFGLEHAAAKGLTLADAMSEVVQGRGAAADWHQEGISEALTLIREGGELPDISGLTGSLTYDPLLNVDIVEGVLTHWTYDYDDSQTLVFAFQRDVVVGENGAGAPRLHDEASEEAFEEPDAHQGTFVPMTPSPTGLKALIIAAAPGWENYRHQADALARYQRLKAAGVVDSDIVMIGPDDIANAPENAAPGTVRNVPGGPDVYAGAQYDYGVDITPDQLNAILLGESSADTPEVLTLGSGDNLYIYVAGHGGLFGVGLGAGTATEGLAGGNVFWEPQALRDTLCTLRAEERVRRVLVELETCHGGVYGDPSFNGVESGCDGGATPLGGVLAISAANTVENSLGAGWDLELHQWVGDEFSVAMQARLDVGAADLSTLYRNVYLAVRGSHVSVYNAAHYGELFALSIDEFITAP